MITALFSFPRHLWAVVVTRMEKDIISSINGYIVGSHGPLKEQHPNAVVIAVLEEEVERLCEREQHHRVNDGERQHISGDHAVDHRNERTR